MRIRLFVLSLLSFLLIAGVGCERMDTRLDPLVIEANQRENPAWYDEAKVGIFIHWGPYAVPGVGEWYWCNRFYDSFVRQYHEDTYGADFPYENFGPMWKELVDDGDTWDPDAWAELFELAGARYVVLTAKHHDGFLLWPSDTPNPYIDGWQLERDAVGELASAVRTRDLRFGVYYSGGYDWTFRFPLGKSVVRMLQMRMDSEPERAYTEAHYRELIERVEPDLLWNDIGYPSGDSLDAKWQMILDYYAAVPDGIINSRFIDTGFIQKPLDANPWMYDLLDELFESATAAEQADLMDFFLNFRAPHYGYATMEFGESADIEPEKWERARTLGGTWGYNRFVTPDDMITGAELIHLLVDIVSKNGNLLINVGPTAEGFIPDMQAEPLLEMGDWLVTNGEAIYGTRPWERAEGETSGEIPVRFTWRPDERMVYAIILGDLPDATIVLKDFPRIPFAISLLGGGQVPGWSRDGTNLIIQLPEALPDQSAHVFAIELRSCEINSRKDLSIDNFSGA